MRNAIRFAPLLTTALLAAALTGCGADEQAPAPAPSATPAPRQPAPEPAGAPPAAPPAADVTGADAGAGADVEAGQKIYAVYCATCHGATGAADTPMAESLDPRPAAHNDGHYMNALSDEYLFRVVEQGGAAVGKSPLMAPWGGTLSDDQIRDVVAYVRTLADPPYTGGD